MGFKIKIVKTEGSLAKADENEILRTLAGAFNEHDGYCKSLFTVEFLRWVGEQIAMDLAPDMWDAFATCHKERGEINEEIMSLKSQVDHYKKAWQEKTDLVNAALKDNRELKQKIDAFEQDVAELEDAREALANQEALIEELQREKTRIADECATAILAKQKIELKMRRAEETILRLKARLYDLEHPEPAASASDQDPLRFPCHQNAAA